MKVSPGVKNRRRDYAVKRENDGENAVELFAVLLNHGRRGVEIF